MSDYIKQRICKQFNQAEKTYDAHASVQRHICDLSLDLLTEHKTAFNRIADFACGTGDSTSALVSRLDFKYCYAIDFATKLLDIARKKLAHKSNVQFFEADFDKKLDSIASLDLIFCNMGLQWSEDLSNSIRLWTSQLSNGGLILFSIPTADNFPELKSIYKPVFYGYHDIVDILLRQGVKVVKQQRVSVIERFDSHLSALKSLKATGTNYSKGGVQKTTLSRLDPDRFFVYSASCQLTYDVGIYLLRKL